MIQIETVERMKPGQLIQHYLLASFCYYQLSQSPLTDSAYDRLCQRLLELHIVGTWCNLNHQHKAFVNRGDLEAGTCLMSADSYPLIVQHGANHYAAKCSDNSIMRDLERHLLPVP